MTTMRLLALLLLVAPATASAETWTGRLAIGATAYAITGNSSRLADGSVQLSLAVSDQSSGPQLHSVIVTVRETGGEISFGAGQARPLPQELSRTWGQQLLTGFRSDLRQDYLCQTKDDEEVCDSRTFVRLDDSLSGRLRVIYNQGRLAGVRFFSLAEWTNPFYEYVSLSLDIR